MKDEKTLQQYCQNTIKYAKQFDWNKNFLKKV